MNLSWLKYGLLLCLIYHKTYSQNFFSFHQIDEFKSEVSFLLPEFSLKNIEKEPNLYNIVCKEAAKCLIKGEPNLPYFSFSFACLSNEKLHIEVISSDYEEIDSINIAPSKGKIVGKKKLTDIPYEYSPIYLQSGFYPKCIVDSGISYVFGETNGVAFHIYPFQFNSIKKKLRIYKNIKLLINKIQKKSVKTKAITLSKSFFSVYKSHYLNFTSLKQTIPTDTGKMLIVGEERFRNMFQDFINWKKLNGILCTYKSLEEIGGSSKLKYYISDYYNIYKISFLLLVGDALEIPPLFRNGYSDAAYGMVSGNDSYPEIIVGRFSGSDSASIKTQIDRSIAYEKHENTESDWLSRFCLIASNEGPGDNNEYDWVHSRNIRDKLLNYTYLSGDEFYDGSHGELDSSGNPDKNMVINALNEGRGILNYIGHGTENQFETTSFSSTDIGSLTNTGKLPIIISVACITGSFVNGTCMAENFLLAKYKNKASGAVAMFASSTDQDWNAPMAANDEIINLLTDSSGFDNYPTLGGILVNACAKMNDVYGAIGSATTDTWILFGDPSLQIRTKKPDTISLDLPDYLVANSKRLDFSLNIEQFNYSIALDSNFLYYKKGTSKFISEELLSLEKTDTVFLFVSAYNRVPTLKKIPVLHSRKYIELGSVVVNDEILGNNSGILDAGEKASIRINLKNIGTEVLMNAVVRLHSLNKMVTFLHDSSFLENIQISDSVSVEFIVDGVKKNKSVNSEIFTVAIIDSSGYKWSYNLVLPIYSPDIKLINYILSDETKNKNNRLEVDENAKITFSLKNNGFSTLKNININLLGLTSSVICSQKDTQIIELKPEELFAISELFTVLPNVINGYFTNIYLVVSYNNLLQADTLKIPIKIGSIIENWENLSKFKLPWKNDRNKPWEFSATSISGKYSLQAPVLAANQINSIKISGFLPQADSISFFLKTNCLGNSDFLNFYINDKLLNSWTGITPWHEWKAGLDAGFKVFRWEYAKNGMVTSPVDAILLDSIILPALNFPPEIQKNKSFVLKSYEKCNLNLLASDYENETCNFEVLKKPDWIYSNNTELNNLNIIGIADSSNRGENKMFVKVSDGFSSILDSLFLFVDYNLLDFEDSVFSSSYFVNSEINPWRLVAIGNEPMCCLKSASITDNQVSSLQMKFTTAFDGYLKYKFKVLSEKGYDFFLFYLDGILMDKWSGEIDWRKIEYQISKGEHIVNFVYKKDDSTSYSDDCVWIDDISFPFKSASSSFEDIDIEDNMSIFPIPVSDILFLKSKNNLQGNEIQILDCFGKKVLSLLFQSKISLASLKSGVYILRCGTYTIKFIKE